jgi:uncharacterized protein (TIGR00369 family)
MTGSGDKPTRRQRHKASPLPFPVVVPFVESLGLELHGYSEGHVELRVDLDEAHLNAWEVAHGGVLMTMMDVGMAMAARSATGHGGGVATIEMKSSFMRPAQHQLRAVAKLLHKTATLAFCEASVFDDEGKLCATATGTFKYLRGLVKRPATNPLTTPLTTPQEGTAP